MVYYLRQSEGMYEVLVGEGFSKNFLRSAAGKNLQLRQEIMFNTGSIPRYRCTVCADFYSRVSEIPHPVLDAENSDMRCRQNRAQDAGFCSRQCLKAMAGEFSADANMMLKSAMIALRPDFYQSDEWRAVRYDAIKKHGRVCQCCGAAYTEGGRIHVDHIIPRSVNPYLALEVTNLQILCDDCNLGKSWKDNTDWRPTHSGKN